MRTPLGGTTAAGWLSKLGLGSSKAAEVLSSFRTGARIELFTFSAPHVFLRFHGAGNHTPIHAPNYWADGSALVQALEHAEQFTGFLSDAEVRKIAKTYYRDVTAICHNWNPLASTSLWKIELIGSERLEGLEGPVAAQPTHAATATSAASGSLLAGGGVQVFLNPATPFICTPVDWDAV